MAEWEPPNKGAPRDKTPEKFDMPKDPNADKESGKNMRYWAFKDRAGNMLMMNHQAGYENITLEHRTGSKFQLLPDGTVHLQSNKGRYTMIFGEDRMQITGSHDIIVKGAASMRVEGDYNVTAAKDMNFNVAGNFNLKALNANIGADCLDIAAKNMTGKVAGAINFSADQSASFISKGNMSLGSTEDSLAIVAGDKMSLVAKSKLMMKSKAKMSLLSMQGVSIEGKQNISIRAGDTLTMQSIGKMTLNCGDDISQKAAKVLSLNADDTISLTSSLNVSAPPIVPGSVVVGPNAVVYPDDAIDDYSANAPKAVECGKPSKGPWGPKA